MQFIFSNAKEFGLLSPCSEISQRRRPYDKYPVVGVLSRFRPCGLEYSVQGPNTGRHLEQEVVPL